jgi:CRISPR/Cas system-associated exonuclease Cas4 (RecB family)
MFQHVDHGIKFPVITRETTETGRRYFTPEGNAYPSITTVLSVMDKTGLEQWKKRVGEDEARRISGQAATRGTAVHKLAEDYLNNVADWKKGHMPSNLFSFQQIKTILDLHVDKIWCQEQFLYSDRLKTAGQVDLIAEFDGELSIIDFKTSRREKQDEWILGYKLQVSFYAAAFYEMTGVPIRRGVIVITVDDSEPQTFKVAPYDYLGQFLSIRKKYRKLRESS